MKTKSLAIILVLAVLMLVVGAAYSARAPKGGKFGPPMKGHPWEEFNNNRPSGCGPSVRSDHHKMTVIPIFSDFFIWISVKEIAKESEHPKDSGKISKKSYQIIFSR